MKWHKSGNRDTMKWHKSGNGDTVIWLSHQPCHTYRQKIHGWEWIKTHHSEQQFSRTYECHFFKTDDKPEINVTLYIK